MTAHNVTWEQAQGSYALSLGAGALPQQATVMTGGRCGSCMANPCMCHQPAACAAPLTGWAMPMQAMTVLGGGTALVESRLSDVDVERIARRVVVLLKAEASVHRDLKPDNMIIHDEGEG